MDIFRSKNFPQSVMSIKKKKLQKGDIFIITCERNVCLSHSFTWSLPSFLFKFYFYFDLHIFCVFFFIYLYIALITSWNLRLVSFRSPMTLSLAHTPRTQNKNSFYFMYGYGYAYTRIGPRKIRWDRMKENLEFTYAEANFLFVNIYVTIDRLKMFFFSCMLLYKHIHALNSNWSSICFLFYIFS